LTDACAAPVVEYSVSYAPIEIDTDCVPQRG
jgi:hypothetical protein